ncbi:MAG: diguanylate cyclase [Pseudomonadota bacterium]
MSTIRRTSLFLCLWLGILTLPLAPAAQATETVTLQLNEPPQFGFAGYYAAQIMGYYQKADLNVTILEGQPGVDGEDLVTRGVADYGTSDSGILLRHAQDQMIVSLATPLQHSRRCLVVAEDRHIDTVHDLAGHSIMLSPDATSIQAYLRIEGLENQVRILPSTAKWEDVASGRVDAMDAIISRDLDDLTRQGVRYKVFRPTSAGIDFYGQVLFTMAQHLRDHPRQVEAFRTASLEGWVYAINHPREMIDWLFKHYPQSNSREDLEWEAAQIRKLVVPEIVEMGYQNPSRWRHIADTLANLKMLPRDYPLKDLIYSPPGQFDLRPYYPYLATGLGLMILLGVFAGYVAWINARLRRLAHRTQSILDAVADGIVGIDQQGLAVFANPAALRILGYDESELMGMNLHALIHRNAQGESMAAPDEISQILAAGSRIVRGETFYAGKQGSLLPVEYALAIVKNRLPSDQAVLAFRDITARKQAELRLKEAASVFENSSDGIFICDPQNRIRRANRAFTAITGYGSEEVMGKNPSVLQSGRHDIHFYIALWYELLENSHWSGEVWNRRKDGTLYPEWLTITAVRDGQGDIAGFIGQFNDISSHKQAEDETRYRGDYDPLTGLPNRHLLLERLKMALREAPRYQRQVALLFVDLDYFKAVNDTLGHLAGDHVLQDVAKRLTACIRETDTAARQGGDEFIVVLQDIEGYDSTAQIAGKIIHTMAEPFLIGHNAVYVGASIGIVISPAHGQDVIELMNKADIALYQAKEKGRNNFQFYQSD